MSLFMCRKNWQEKCEDLKLTMENIIKEKQEEIDALKKKLDESYSKQYVHDCLGKVFTPGQVKMLLNPSQKRVKWTTEDMTAAMAAHNHGNRSYEYWRLIRHLPHPAPSTIRKWAGGVNFEPGLLSPILKHMKIISKSMEEVHCLSITAFDDVYLSNQIDVDKRYEQVVSMCFAH